MSDIQPILTNYQPLPRPPKVTAFDWIGYYLYNLFRKPKVWKAKRELMFLAGYIQTALINEVYPELAMNSKCEECRNALAALKPQVFLSQIKLILIQMVCPEHSDIFKTFLEKHLGKFRKSEEISKWINGFS